MAKQSSKGLWSKARPQRYPKDIQQADLLNNGQKHKHKTVTNNRVRQTMLTLFPTPYSFVTATHLSKTTLPFPVLTTLFLLSSPSNDFLPSEFHMIWCSHHKYQLRWAVLEDPGLGFPALGLSSYLSTVNWRLPGAFARGWMTARAFVTCLLGDWTLGCGSCRPSTPLEGNSGWNEALCAPGNLVEQVFI